MTDEKSSLKPYQAPLELRTHGRGGYNAGCRCQICFEAARAAARRDRQKRRQVVQELGDLPPGVSHGPGGSSNWGCLCDVCRSAKRTENRRERERVKAGLLVHNSGHGWTSSCPCAKCVKRRNLHVYQKNAKSADTAHRRWQEWTGPELEIASRSDLTAAEVAKALGRTLAGVAAIRRKLRTDPRKIRLAGVPSTPALNNRPESR